MLRQFVPVCAIARRFDSNIHPVGAIRANMAPTDGYFAPLGD
jgi:hypothetical protein